jgi:predicted transposase/invertase (TIGR01784 family)
MAVHFDELWKNIIEKLFPHFLSFFMPELSADVDLAQGYEFLDKELQKIKLKGKKGKKFADKLVKVRLKDGAEKWLLIHVEVQGKHEEDFGQRMFRYFYRIYDKHDVDITALAVLTYKTDQQYDFNYDVYGSAVTYRFNTAFIANYSETELQNNKNPFALVCLAVQYDNRFRDDEEKKFRLKRGMIKMLRDRGYKKEAIIELLEFIDDAIQITDTMKNKIFDEEAMHLLEEDEPMAYVSGFRQRAILEGELKGELKGLMEGLMGMMEIKFGSVPSEFEKKIHKISELSKLEILKEGIKRATDLEQVQKLL